MCAKYDSFDTFLAYKAIISSNIIYTKKVLFCPLHLHFHGMMITNDSNALQHPGQWLKLWICFEYV